MKQVKLDDWGYVETIIKARKDKRIRWSKYFGCSLTKAVTHYRNKGYDSNKTIQKLKSELLEHGMPSNAVMKRLIISVRSRYAEQQTYNSRKGLI